MNSIALTFKVNDSFKSALMIFLILAAGLVMRLHNLNKYDLWFDELISERFGFQSLQGELSDPKAPVLPLFIKRLSTDQHSPLYYLCVYTYRYLLGERVSLRWMSFLFSMLSLIMVYNLSTLFFNRRQSMYALLISALSPLQIWYAQEARGYALAVFLTLAMIYCFMRALSSHRVSWWVRFSFAGALAFYASYFSVLFFFILGVFLLSGKDRRCIFRGLLSFGVIALFLLPITPIFIQQWSSVKHGFWLEGVPKVKTILSTFRAFSLGYSATPGQHRAGLAIFFSLFMYGFYSYFVQNKKNALFLLSLVSIPIIVTYVFSAKIVAIYLDRQLLIFSPFFYLLIARGIGSFSSRIVEAGIGIIVGGALVFSLNNYYAGRIKPYSQGVWPKKQYNRFIAEVGKEFGKDDTFAVTDGQSWAILKYYFYKIDQKTSGKTYFFFDPDALAKHVKSWFEIELPAGSQNVYALAKRGEPMSLSDSKAREVLRERVWVFSSTWDKTGSLENNTRIIRQFFEVNNYQRKMFRKYDGIEAELYVKRR